MFKRLIFFYHEMQDKNSILSRKVLLHILLVSTCITVVITGAQLYKDYSQGVYEIEQRLNDIEASLAKTVSAALWLHNDQILTVLLQSIRSLPDIEYVRLTPKDSQEIIVGKVPYVTESLIQYITGRHLEKQIILSHEDFIIGDLYILASLEQVYIDVWKKFVFVIIAQMMKTLIVSAIIVFILYTLILRHITAIIQQTLHIHRCGEVSTIDINKQTSTPPDEIDALVQTLNEMNNTIAQDKIAKEQHLREIEKINEILQLHIKSKTSNILNQEAEIHELFQCIQDRTHELKSTELFNQTIIDSLPCSLIVITREGNIVLFNKASENLLKYSKDLLLQQSLLNLLPEPYCQNPIDYFLDLFRDNQEIKTGKQKEIIYINQNAERIHTLTSLTQMTVQSDTHHEHYYLMIIEPRS